MKNAHERFGVLEYTKRMKDTTTRIRLRLDRFIGEVESEGTCKAHLISVLGGDSDVGESGQPSSSRTTSPWKLRGLIQSLSASVKARSASGEQSILPDADPSGTWLQSRLNWPRHVQERTRKASGPSCVIAIRPSCFTASRSGMDCPSCRSGRLGSTRNSTTVGRPSLSSDCDALRCWSAAPRSCS